MNVFVITAAVGVVALAWWWLKKPVRPASTRMTARTWPVSRGKTVGKSKLARPS
jgi:hypothetical protein